jgi:type VI secretion system protein ImpJ
MSDRNKVIWSEGQFLLPQHFQQQERYFERYVEGRAGGLRTASWGFEELEIDRDLLAIGKLALKRAKGVFPDGTPFSIPDHDPTPQPLEVSVNLRDTRVLLALPLRRAGALDSDRRTTADGLVRQIVREIELRDATQETAASAAVEVGGLRTRLIADGEPTEDFACVPMAQVAECRSDRQVLLDDRFMPTVLRVKACAPLDTFLTEFLGMLRQRIEAFAVIVGSGGRGGVAELRDFLSLQAIGRYEGLIRHFAESTQLHPEDFYRWALVIAGDFAALTTERRRGGTFPHYQHDDLRASLEPLIAALRTYTPNPAVSPVVSIVVELKRPNQYVARIPDSSLLETSAFILAVRADMPEKQIERSFPQMTTIAPVTRLNALTSRHDPGFTLSSLPQIPPNIPFRAGYVYFEVVRSSSLWPDMKGSGAFGLFIPDGFPNLALEMWAVRGK